MIGNLKKGDKVVAAGGIYGDVNKIEDNVLYLEIAENVKIKLAKSAVTVSDPFLADRTIERICSLTNLFSFKIFNVSNA